MRKLTLTALILSLAIILIAACSSDNGGGTQSPSTNNPPASSNETPPADSEDDAKSPFEGTTLTMLTQNHNAWPFNPDWLVWDAIEHYTGIKMDVNAYQGNWWEAIPLTIASGDMPDIMWMNGGSNVWKYGSEGALVNLLDHIDKMPNLQKIMEERPEEVAAALSYDGKLYSSPMRSEGGSQAIHQLMLLHRQDIFEKHNIDIPKTTDEFIEVLRELKRLYPDSYPLLPNPGTANIRSSAESWGTSWGPSITPDGEPIYGFITDEFRQMLEFFNLLYEEGLMHPELLTMDTNQRQSLIANNQAFIIYSYQNQIASLQDLIRPEIPEFTLAFMPPPETPMGYAYLGPAPNPGVGGWTIPVTANIDAAIWLLDWSLSDEGQLALNFGIEGETFDFVDGKPVFKQEIIDMGSTEKNRKYGLSTSGANHNSSIEADMQLLNDQARYAVEEAQKYLGPPQPDPAMTPEETEFKSIQGEALNTHASENISKFIIGTRPFSEWDDFVEEHKKLNAEKLMENYYNAWLRTQQ